MLRRRKANVASFLEAWIEIDLLEVLRDEVLSPPSWRRGLKSEFTEQLKEGRLVASFLEAWIEICVISFSCVFPVVASFLEAWIEISAWVLPYNGRRVASFLEAWIEIILIEISSCLTPVASFLEAWIEIIKISLVENAVGRLLLGGVD